jgi:hypothetical protein
MKFLLAFLLLALPALAAPPVLTPLKYRVIFDETKITRPESDRRCCVWTDDSSQATPLLGTLGVRSAEAVTFQKGEVFAVFLNDTITDDLTAIIHNETADETFADYADAGIRFKLMAPPAGMKYTHLTAVIFTPAGALSRLGIRGMIPDMLSEKYPPDAK